MFNFKSYKIGKKSTQAFKDAIKDLLGDTDVARELHKAAPYLCNKNVDLSGYELWAIAEWLENPEGPPPSAKFEALRDILRDCNMVVDDSELERMAEEAEGDVLL